MKEMMKMQYYVKNKAYFIFELRLQSWNHLANGPYQVTFDLKKY